MNNQPITLGQLIETLGQGADKVTIVDPIYDEQRDVTCFDASHNMEMFFACIDDDPSDMMVEDLQQDPSRFDDVSYYGLYAFMNPSGDFRDALPVKDIGVTDNGRVLLFV